MTKTQENAQSARGKLRGAGRRNQGHQSGEKSAGQAPDPRGPETRSGQKQGLASLTGQAASEANEGAGN